MITINDFKMSSEEYLSTLESLVKIKSNYFHEEDILQYIYKRLKEQGISVQMHEYHDKEITKFKGKNVIGRIGNSKSGVKILLNAHVDTVNIVSGWNYAPLEMTIDKNIAYGLGICDMKSGVASIILAIEKFAKIESELEGEIIFSFVSVEEGPFGLGTNYLIHDHLIDDADVAIVMEPSAAFDNSSYPNICLGARGGTSYQIDFYGKAAHAANPHLGVSAIKDAAKVINQMDQLVMKDDGILGAGSNCIINFKGGGDACSVAEYAYFEVFRHMVMGETNETVFKEIKDLIENSDIKSDYAIKFRKGPTPDSDGFMPYVVKKNNPFVDQFANVVRTISKKEPKYSYFSSIGDFNYLGSRLNIPVIVFGAAGGNYHSADEWLDINSAISMTEVLFGYLAKLLL